MAIITGMKRNPSPKTIQKDKQIIIGTADCRIKLKKGYIACNKIKANIELVHSL